MCLVIMFSKKPPKIFFYENSISAYNKYLPHYILKCFMPTLKKQIVWNMLEHKNYIFLKSQEIDDWAHASLPF